MASVCLPSCPGKLNSATLSGLLGSIWGGRSLAQYQDAGDQPAQ